jgi:hypothetical protein
MVQRRPITRGNVGALLALILVTVGAGLVATPARAVAQTETVVRIMAVDGDTGALTVLDGGSGAVVGRFTTPGGGFTPVYASESGRYLVVNHYDHGAITVIDSGLRVEPHGDHVDLEIVAPFVRATVVTGGKPAHYWAHDGIIAVYNDGDGSVTIFDERRLPSSADPRTFSAGPPDHASLATLDGMLLVGFYGSGRVDAYRMDGMLAREGIATCPGAHGEGRSGGVVAFGCADGVLLIAVAGGELTARKVPYPAGTGMMDRVNLIAAHPRSAVMVGDLPSGLAFIHRTEGTIEMLPTSSRPLWMSFSGDGTRVVVLTADGVAHVVDPMARRVLTSTPATWPYERATQAEAGAFYPFIATAGTMAYLPDPSSGEVVELAIATGQVTRRMQVGGRPARVAVASASGIVH